MAQRGVNSVTIVGNLGADPEVKNNVTSIRVATTETWKDKETQETQERTEWHRIKAFSGLAKIIGDYAKKGRQVYVRGSLRTDKYTDKDGVERFSTEIIAEDFQLLGSNPDRGQD